MSKDPAHPLITFVVLNWNGLDDTKICIESLRKVDYPNKELIIVDNGSSDGSKEYLRSLKDIRLVDLPENIGFAGGHIAGRQAAKGAYLAIVNNDLVLDKHWAKACLETFGRHDDAAVVGGRAYKWDDGNPVHNLDNEYYSFQEIDQEKGYARTILTGAEECAVDSISGAAMMIKQSALKKTGYFDDDFFAYFEETDLAARLLRAGFKAYYNPQARTWHKIAASTKDDSSFYLYMMHRNRYFFAVKNFDDKYLKRFIKNYRQEAWLAGLRYLKNRRNLDAKCRLKAYLWIKRHKSLINRARSQVQKLGGDYNKRLWQNRRDDVTVIITCYNYGRYVAEAINSALDQTLALRKIIIINDGSTDNSRAVIDGYKNNSSIEIVHKSNGGIIAARNLGIKLSQTYWTVFLDADDKLDESFIESTVKASKNGEFDIVYTDMQMFGTLDHVFKARPFSVPTLIKANYINNSTLIKTSYMKQVGGLKPQMKLGLEDWEMYISLVEAGAKPFYLPLPLVKYRQHDKGLSRRAGYDDEPHINEQLNRQMRDLHRSFYRKNNYKLALMKGGLSLIGYTVRYPGLLIVYIKAIPGAVLHGLRHLRNQSEIYLSEKRDTF